MDEKTSIGKIVAAVGGVLLIVSLFLKWAGADIPEGLGDVAGQLGSQLGGASQQAFENAQSQISDAASMNAWDLFGFIPFLYILIGVLAIIPLALDLFDMEIELPFESSLVTLVGGLLALGGMLVVLDSPGGSKIGLWIALIAAIAITVGGVMQIGDEGGDEVAAVPPAAPAAGYAPPPAAAPTAPAPTAPPAQQPPAPQPPSPQPPAGPPPGA